MIFVDFFDSMRIPQRCYSLSRSLNVGIIAQDPQYKFSPDYNLNPLCAGIISKSLKSVRTVAKFSPT
jgi:hypothetical protein